MSRHFEPKKSQKEYYLGKLVSWWNPKMLQKILVKGCFLCILPIIKESVHKMTTMSNINRADFIQEYIAVYITDCLLIQNDSSYYGINVFHEKIIINKNKHN